MHRSNAAAIAPLNSNRSGVLRRNLRALLLWPALGLTLGVMLWAVTYASIDVEKRNVEAKGLKDAAALSRTYAAYLNRTVEQLDQFTLYLKNDWEHSGRNIKLEDFQQKKLFSGQHSTSLSIYDRNGRPVTSTVPVSRDLSIQDRSYFQFHRMHGSDALVIGSPVAGRMTGKTVIPVTRRLTAEDDSFDGIVLAGVDPEFFFLATSDVVLGEAGILALASADGKFRLTRLGNGKIQASEPLLVKVPAVSSPMLLNGKHWFSDSQNRYVASQPLDSYPLLAIVGLSQQQILLSYEQARVHYQRVAMAISILLAIFALIATLLSIRLILRKERLEAISSTYRLATEGAKEGFYMYEAIRNGSGQVTDFRIVDCNERGAALAGMTKADLLNKTLSEIAKPTAYFRALLAQYKHAIECGFYEDDFKVPKTSVIPVEWLHRQMVRSGDGLAVTFRDISDQKRHEEELTRLATRDSLTGLPNMHWLKSYLPAALERASNARRPLALLFMDIDDFKDVNVALGHATGNQLLQEIGARLQSVLQPADHAVRRAGGAFCVVLESIADRDEAINAAHGILAAFQEPFKSVKRRKAVTVSTGISLFPEHGLTTDELINHADIAMYAAKAECRGKFRLYEQRLYDRIQQRLDMEQEMLRAIEERHFVMYYQPRVDTLSGKLVGMEALVRWNHPERGMVLPNEFIPLAESNGLIVPLGELIMDLVCAELASWRQQCLPVVPVSVNVSARQFDEGNVKELVSSRLAKYRIPANLLELELTETAMMGDFEAVKNEVDAINALGVRMHVDDFGIGYSSLSLLHRLNLNVLKIDRTFTSQLGSGQDGQIFFTAIVSMANELGMTVVAEGVETEEQLRILQGLECDEIQGYFVLGPLPAHDMPAVMNRQMLFSEPHRKVRAL